MVPIIVNFIMFSGSLCEIGQPLLLNLRLGQIHFEVGLCRCSFEVSNRIPVEVLRFSLLL
jgi:hypothetical protein